MADRHSCQAPRIKSTPLRAARPTLSYYRMDFSIEDREALAAAVRRLQSPSFAGRLAALAGKPVGIVQRALPAAASVVVARAAKSALEHALALALFTFGNRLLTWRP